MARTPVHISSCTANPLCLGHKDPVSLAAGLPACVGRVQCVCGPLSGMGTLMPGLEQSS